MGLKALEICGIRVSIAPRLSLVLGHALARCSALGAAIVATRAHFPIAGSAKRVVALEGTDAETLFGDAACGKGV